ncbi:MAG: HlyD family efflux transporter periplasmic adaptor subunit [Bacteroidota bacterium]
MKYTIIILLTTFIVVSCTKNKNDFDATGAFESVETIISTEAAGTLLQFNVEEGQVLSANQPIGIIDTTQLYLRKKQIEAQIDAILGQKPDIPVQIAALQEQLKQAELNQQRLKNLVKADAAPQKQLDDANTQIDVIKRQIEAQTSTLDINSQTVSRNVPPLEKQIAQLNDQLRKCRVINPVHGTVLTKYAQQFEITAPGKALYKIAELDTIILRAFVTGTQLSKLKLGQKMTVQVDDGSQKMKAYSGLVFWISDKSEFTPKTVQTKEERADLVYAIKVRIVNDGFLKIGMYGEVKF